MKLEKIPTLLVLFCGLALLLTGCSSGGAAEPPPATPDEAFVRVTRSLADGRPEAIWHALPASYQKDVTDLVHQAAGTMDEEVWNQSFLVMEKLTRMLEEKRDYILSYPMLAAQMKDRGEAERNWKGVVGVLEVLLRSELADLDSLKILDVESFLSGTGSRFMKQMASASSLSAQDPWGQAMSKMRETKVTVVSSSGDRATLRLESPGSPPQEMPFTRLEGKWIPKQMADEWEETIAGAREALAGLSPERMRQGKQALMMQLGMAEGALDSLLRAESESEFHAGLGSMMGLAFGAMMSQAAQMQAGPASGFPGQPTPLRPPVDALQPVPEQAEPPPAAEPPVMDFPPSDESISPRDAGRYVGRMMKVTTRDGRTVTGTLVEVEGGSLVFEKSFGGGTMAVKFSADEIESMRPTYR